MAGVAVFFWRDELRAKFFPYPAEVSLTDQNGRKIEVHLLGRSGDSVQFTKQNGFMVFDYPLSDLGFFSRMRVRLYELRPHHESSSSRKATEEVNLAEFHRDGIVAELERLKTRYRLLELEFYGSEAGSPSESIRGEARQVLKRIMRLEHRLAAFDARQGNDDRGIDFFEIDHPTGIGAHSASGPGEVYMKLIEVLPGADQGSTESVRPPGHKRPINDAVY